LLQNNWTVQVTTAKRYHASGTTCELKIWNVKHIFQAKLPGKFFSIHVTGQNQSQKNGEFSTENFNIPVFLSEAE
jgi:hypothetical protein